MSQHRWSIKYLSWNLAEMFPSSHELKLISRYIKGAKKKDHQTLCKYANLSLS
jgi:hypothetical protein